MKMTGSEPLLHFGSCLCVILRSISGVGSDRLLFSSFLTDVQAVGERGEPCRDRHRLSAAAQVPVSTRSVPHIGSVASLVRGGLTTVVAPGQCLSGAMLTLHWQPNFSCKLWFYDTLTKQCQFSFFEKLRQPTPRTNTRNSFR